MGIIVAKFKRKKTTYDVLENLENEIKAIEEFGRDTEQTQKRMVGRFIFVSVFTYFASAFIFYLYFFRVKPSDSLIYIIPLILLPFLIFFIKKILTWYYSRKLRKNQKKLVSLKEQKKKILDEVMDKETYKVAKTILDKFAPEQVKKPDYSVALTPTPTITSNLRTQPGLRYRFPAGQFTPQRIPPTPGLAPQFVQRSTPMHLALPRSILPKERSVIDKMVDYLVGDGPSNRFALICKNCAGHNGMALKEEFEYLSFRCCYCSTLNPARKQRPSAPTLELTESLLQTDNRSNTTSEDDDDDNDKRSGSRSATPPLITELSDDEQKPAENVSTEPMETDASTEVKTETTTTEEKTEN